MDQYRSYRSRVVILGVGVVICNISAFVVMLLMPEPLSVQVPQEQAVSSGSNKPSESEPIISDPHTSSAVLPVEPNREGTKKVPAEVDSVRVPVYTACSVLEAMRAEERNKTLTFAGKEYPGLGLFIEEIQGVRPSEGRYWILYINGEPATRGVSEALVGPGDVVEWKLEKSIY